LLDRTQPFSDLGLVEPFDLQQFVGGSPRDDPPNPVFSHLEPGGDSSSHVLVREASHGGNSAGDHPPLTPGVPP